MKHKEKVYLAGGMKSGWQDTVIEKYGDKFIFFNPRDHKLNKPDQFSTWDLHHVKSADIIFAYFESDNPSGIGMTLEIGYARGLNKTIILVDEKSPSDSFFANKFRIVRNSADVVLDSLEEGLAFLERFSIYSI